MAQQEESITPYTFRQVINVVYAFLQLPALTVMAFIRRRIGLRTLNIQFFPLICCGLLVLSSMASTMDRGALWAALYAVALMVTLFVTAWKRWRELLVKGLMWHTYSRGISRPSWLPIPSQVTHIVVDPLACLLLGLLLVSTISKTLGVWLCSAAVAMFFTELIVFCTQLERVLDMMDARIDAEVQNAQIQGLSPEPLRTKTLPAPSIEDYAGILPTGASQQLKRKIDLRKSLLRNDTASIPPAAAEQRNV